MDEKFLSSYVTSVTRQLNLRFTQKFQKVTIAIAARDLEYERGNLT
jgi:hypothetical protein